ncbi:hypothetical protein D3C77_306400 [compost metagenome]
MAAVQLYAEAGDFLAAVGEEGFDDRDQQGRAPPGIAAAVFKVELAGGVGGEHAAAFAQGFLGQQHAPHIGVDDDRVGGFVRRHRAADGPRLQALTGIGQAALERRFGDAQALQADLKARVVHHGEHAGQALVGLPHQPAGGAVEIHHTGGRALDAHLVFQRTAAQGIALAEGAVGIHQHLGHQEQADALDPGRCLGQARQHQVDNVGAQVLLAAADENLAAAELVAAVGLGQGTGTQQGQVGAGLGFGEAHGAGPFAADQLRQVALLELGAAVALQRQHRAFGEPGIDSERQRRSHQHLVKTGRDHLRETLAAEFQRPGHARPTLLDVQLVGLTKAIRGSHLAVLQTAALLVAVAIERRHHFGGKACGFFEHAIDGFAVQAIAQLLAMATGIEQLVQHETHFAQRCLVTHTRPSCTAAKPLPAATSRAISAAGRQCSPSMRCKRCRRSWIEARPWPSAQCSGPPTAAGKP